MDKLKLGLTVLFGILLLSSAVGFLSQDQLKSVITPRQVQLIQIHGLLSREAGGFFPSGTVNIESVKRELETAVANPLVGSIVLDIDSPGGSAAPTQDLVFAIEAAKKEKPIVAYVSDVGASGGYWLAASANKIVVAPLAVLGSIGVFSEFVDASELLEKLGVNYYVVKTGKYKDAGSFNRPLTDEERAQFQSLTDAVYQEFVSSIAASRNMTFEEFKPLAQGQIFLGRQAVSLRLADQVGSRQDSIALAANLANISNPEVLEPRKSASLQDLFSEFSQTAAYGFGRGLYTFLAQNSYRVYT